MVTIHYQIGNEKGKRENKEAERSDSFSFLKKRIFLIGSFPNIGEDCPETVRIARKLTFCSGFILSVQCDDNVKNYLLFGYNKKPVWLRDLKKKEKWLQICMEYYRKKRMNAGITIAGMEDPVKSIKAEKKADAASKDEENRFL